MVPVTRALVIQHHPVETLGANLSGVLAQRGIFPETILAEQAITGGHDLPVPPLDNVRLIIALGGPMSANDTFPAIRQERDYLAEAVRREIPVFGVCLGAQLLSTALCGIVRPTGGYQFGLRKIDITPEGAADPVSSRITVPLVPTLHGECFSLPPGGVKLAEGYMLRRDGRYRKINMAFRCGNSYAFQFEPQLTLADLQVWNQELAADYRLMGSRFDPDEESARHLREFTAYAPTYEAQMRQMFQAFLDNAGFS